MRQRKRRLLLRSSTMSSAGGSRNDATRAGADGGFVGRIPVRNLWLLMLYASDFFKVLGEGRVAFEDTPDELPHLVARTLCLAVESRLRTRLSSGYATRHAVLGRVRGRIDVLTTESRQLLARGAVSCRFDELTVDTPRNQMVMLALNTVARQVSPELREHCTSLARLMQRMGVSEVRSRVHAVELGSLTRNDSADLLMVSAAKLALEMLLPTEGAGRQPMYLPDREVRWVRSLFEKAVGGFYSVVLDRSAWDVRRGQWLKWQISRSTVGVEEIMPGMQTDIVLDDRRGRRRVVVDTKFTGIVTAGWRREATLRSGYIYQMYAYLRSQVGGSDVLANTATGVLLHPAIDESVDEAVMLQGHVIRFTTVDLTAPIGRIREELLRICDHVSFPSAGIH